MQEKYCLDFVLRAYGHTVQTIRNALAEFGENLEIAEGSVESGEARDFSIRLFTEDPTLIFDACSQLGRIKSVKVEEERRL